MSSPLVLMSVAPGVIGVTPGPGVVGSGDPGVACGAVAVGVAAISSSSPPHPTAIATHKHMAPSVAAIRVLFMLYSLSENCRCGKTQPSPCREMFSFLVSR